MKLFTRITLLMVLALTLAAPTAALAQDEMPCFGLDQASCDILYKVGPETFSSFAMSYTFSVSYTGEGEDTAVSSEGTGDFSLVESAEDPLKSFNMKMAGTGGDSEGSGAYEFRIIDGVFYMMVEGEEAWMSFPLEKGIEMADMPFDMESMMAGNMDAMEGMGEAADMMGQMGPLMDMAGSYVTATREDVDGQAQITVAFDLTGLLSDPELSTNITDMFMANPEMLTGMAGGMGAEAVEMTEEELEQSAQMMGMMIPMFGMMFQQADISYTLKADAADNTFGGFMLHVALVIDPSMMSGMMGGESDAEVEPVEVMLDLEVNVWDYDAAFTYEVPEGAVELDMDTME
jgi:hypothetical protein